MAALSDRDRLSDLLSESYLATHGGWGPVADKLLAAGVTLPPAPVDPAWFEEAGKVAAATETPRCDYPDHYPACYFPIFRALLAAGYRVIPPTQDRAAVIARAQSLYATAEHFTDPERTGLRGFPALYAAGMLVEGDGR